LRELADRQRRHALTPYHGTEAIWGADAASGKDESDGRRTRQAAILYRMATPEHTCPYGIKARDLLRRSGFRSMTGC
jgi:hypothetical protein